MTHVSLKCRLQFRRMNISRDEENSQAANYTFTAVRCGALARDGHGKQPHGTNNTMSTRGKT